MILFIIHELFLFHSFEYGILFEVGINLYYYRGVYLCIQNMGSEHLIF